MLPSAQKPPTGNNSFLDLRQMHLDHHSLFSGFVVSHFRDAISWPTDFEENLSLNGALGWCDCQLGFFGVPGGSASKVGLMLLSLGMSKV